MSGDRVTQSTQDLIEDIVHPVLIAGMMTCIMAALVAVVKRFGPGWRGEPVVILTFLVCLEGITSGRVIDERGLEDVALVRFRVVEWLVIMIALRVTTILAGDLGPLPGILQEWPGEPGSLFDLAYLALAVALFAAWRTSISLAHDLSGLKGYLRHAASASAIHGAAGPRSSGGQDPDDSQAALKRIAQIQGRVNYRFPIPPPSQQRASVVAQRRITRPFALGAVVVLVLTSLTRIDAQGILTPQGPAPGAVVGATLYFPLGLALLSQAHLRIQSWSWKLDRVRVPRHLAGRWLALIGVFVGLGVVVALLLPTGYPTALLGWLSSRVGSWLSGIPDLLSALFVRRDRQLSDMYDQFRETGGGFMGLPAYRPIASGPGVPWWQTVRSVLFWMLLVAVGGYSLFRFMQDRGGLLRWLSGIPLLRWVAQLLRDIRAAIGGLVSGAGESVGEWLARSADRETSPWPRYLSLRSLSPTQLVRYFYLSTLRRAENVGQSRDPHQTPYEYEGVLSAQVAEVADDLRQLTEAFVGARYGQGTFEVEELDPIRVSWRRLRSALRALGRTRGKGRSAEHRNTGSSSSSA